MTKHTSNRWNDLQQLLIIIQHKTNRTSKPSAKTKDTIICILVLDQVKVEAKFFMNKDS